MNRALAAGALVLLAVAPITGQERSFDRPDTLRGSDGPARAWWDVVYYDLSVSVNPPDSSLSGVNRITYRALTSGSVLQLDLQAPMTLDSVIHDGGAVLVQRREGNAWFVSLPVPDRPGSEHTVAAWFHGQPRPAARPPWDGGLSWDRDASDRPWVVTSNQGLGASVWWPNKDLMSEEPDSQRISVTVPDPMVDVSNGRLRATRENGDGTVTYEWFVGNPVNNYSISINAGSYAHWSEVLEGEDGRLSLDFWPLAEHEADARRQWTQARSTIQCFERWFGPYPWYEDGYKLVEVPYLGMEHQSAVTYGNGFRNGYRGTDLSGTGLGLEWDFIIVHESAHEWWGNNLTAADAADLWIHESFANYAENLYTECTTGSADAGARYVIGTRARISNDRPIQGQFGVNDEGSGDKYYKGGNLLHTIRQLTRDDGRWRSVLRGLNRDFRHHTVTGRQVEEYIARNTGVELGAVFDQYLRTTMVPVLEYQRAAGLLSFRWTNVVPGFAMPVRVTLGSEGWSWITPREGWQTVDLSLRAGDPFLVDDDFYVEVREVAPSGTR